jgi:hypothetical protein
LAKLVGQMATTHEQIEWLVNRTVAVCNEWPGPRVLRQIFCSKFKPRDGIEAGSTEAFPEGLPRERIAEPPRAALPAGRVATLNAGLDKQIKDAAAAKDMSVSVHTPAYTPDLSHMDELRRAKLRREHREIMEAMGVKPVTQADIDRALLESRAKRMLESHDPHTHKTH